LNKKDAPPIPPNGERIKQQYRGGLIIKKLLFSPSPSADGRIGKRLLMI